MTCSRKQTLGQCCSTMHEDTHLKRDVLYWWQFLFLWLWISDRNEARLYVQCSFLDDIGSQFSVAIVWESTYKKCSTEGRRRTAEKTICYWTWPQCTMHPGDEHCRVPKRPLGYIPQVWWDMRHTSNMQRHHHGHNTDVEATEQRALTISASASGEGQTWRGWS